MSELLLADHGGEVPADLEALEKLPGVGHKTASVVMAQAFGLPTFPVDTHIHRLAQRWGLTRGRNVVETERDLKRAFPEARWNALHLQIIYYGESTARHGAAMVVSARSAAPATPRENTPSVATRRDRRGGIGAILLLCAA